MPRAIGRQAGFPQCPKREKATGTAKAVSRRPGRAGLAFEQIRSWAITRGVTNRNWHYKKRSLFSSETRAHRAPIFDRLRHAHRSGDCDRAATKPAKRIGKQRNGACGVRTRAQPGRPNSSARGLPKPFSGTSSSARQMRLDPHRLWPRDYMVARRTPDEESTASVIRNSYSDIRKYQRNQGFSTDIER